MVIWRLFSL